MESENKKINIDEFLYYSQYRKKLSLIYFFITKEGVLWLAGMYILYNMINFLFFSIIMLLSFAYVIREFFHYSVNEKYELAVFKKIIHFLEL